MNSRVARLQGFRFGKFQHSKLSKFEDSKYSRAPFQGFRVPRFLGSLFKVVVSDVHRLLRPNCSKKTGFANMKCVGGQTPRIYRKTSG